MKSWSSRLLVIAAVAGVAGCATWARWTHKAEPTTAPAPPAGGKIQPHWHPKDEHVTVIKGTIFFGMGEKLHKRGAHEFPAGSYLKLPAKMPHFAWTSRKGESIIQVHGMGPFQVIFVNPADDPRNKPAKR